MNTGGSPPSGPTPRWPASALFAVLGLAVIVVFYALPLLGAPLMVPSALYAGFSGVATVAILYGTVRLRPAARTPWLLLAAGQATYTVADVTYYVQSVVLGSDAFPSLSDVFYLAQYPFIVAALVAFVRRRTPGWHIATLVDAAIIATGMALIWWVYLVHPMASAPDLSTPARVVVLAYPVGDLLVLAVALRLMLGAGTRTPAFHLLVGSLVAMLLGDIVFGIQTALGTYEDFSWVDSLWIVSYTLVGVAALNPSMRHMAERSAVGAPDATPMRLVTLAVASLLAPALLLVRHAQGDHGDVPVIGVAYTVLFLLVLIRMAGLVAAQRKLAVTDGLTGLYTRGFFEETLRVECGRAERSGQPLGVLIVDADHFKSINDSYGHPAGDRVLCELARRLRTVCRPGDIVARYGGEEFAMLLPGAGPVEVAGLAERVRHAVGSQEFALEYDGVSRIAVTVSIGAATMPTDASCPVSLVQIADRALYAAKHAGRDRVVTAAEAAQLRSGRKVPVPRRPTRRSSIGVK